MQRRIWIVVALAVLALLPAAWCTTAAAAPSGLRANAAACHLRRSGEVIPSEVCPAPIGVVIRPGLAAVAAAAAVVAAKCLQDPRCRHDDYKKKFQEHHVVAQRAGSLNEPRKAPKAAPGRAILARFGMTVNDEANLVGLTTGFHQRLHTNPYYAGVNLTVKEASLYGRPGIEYALNIVANQLTTRDAAFVP
jgi:hypothetical protein